MTDDPIRRLADADPARDLDPEPREDLLRETLALPRSSSGTTNRRGKRTGRRVLAPAVALGAAAVLAAIALLVDPSGPRGLDLAARAYAQTSADPGQIVYTRVTWTSGLPPAASGEARRASGSIEEWHRGGEVRRFETLAQDVEAGAGLDDVMQLDSVIDVGGVMHQVTGEGSYRIVRPSDNEDAANVIAQWQDGFIADFRRRYERGELDPAGDVQFAGRPARRYLVASVVPAEQAFYIDRESGAPLGSTSILYAQERSRGDAFETTTTRSVQIVRAIERLEPTAENLKKLRTHSLPRRRDADGCIRGPVTNARSSDSASKRDCGGTPGAALSQRELAAPAP